jgi:hypothetical protein
MPIAKKAEAIVRPHPIAAISGRNQRANPLGSQTMLGGQDLYRTVLEPGQTSVRANPKNPIRIAFNG